MPHDEENLNEEQLAKLARLVADALEKKLESRFYGNLGRGLWSLAWKGIIVAVIVISVYGAKNGFHIPKATP